MKRPEAILFDAGGETVAVLQAIAALGGGAAPPAGAVPASVRVNGSALHMEGRSMRLVGHADPRGESEYNMVLGDRRASNVKGAIANEGLAAERDGRGPAIADLGTSDPGVSRTFDPTGLEMRTGDAPSRIHDEDVPIPQL